MRREAADVVAPLDVLRIRRLRRGEAVLQERLVAGGREGGETNLAQLGAGLPGVVLPPGSGGVGEGGRGDTGGVSGSPDSGGSSSPADAGSPDGRQVSVATDAIDTSRLRRSGCECDLSQSSRGTPGLPFALLGAALGRPVAAHYEPARPGDVRHSLADISQAKAVLGYTAPVDFLTGLARTLAWFGQQRSTP